MTTADRAKLIVFMTLSPARLRASNARLRDIPCGVKTKDEIKDPQKLAMWLNVNGEKRQRGNTSTMIFYCRHIERKSGGGMQAGSVVIG